MLLAILERIAASKRLDWAQGAGDEVERDGLVACADREDEITQFIESLEVGAAGRTASLYQRFPNFETRYDELMTGLSLTQQLRVQAEGETGGA